MVTDTGNNYLLQKINRFVFKDVEDLMNNVVKVTHHLAGKLKNINGSVPEKEVLTLVETKNNTHFLSIRREIAGEYLFF